MSLSRLSRERWRLALALSSVVVVVYFGFVLLIAFQRELMSVRILPGLTLGILLGALVIVISWAVTWYYVRWANRHFDHQVRQLREQAGAR